MRFQKGNTYWQRANVGKPKIFETPEDMWNKACEYFDWALDNCLYEYKPYNGELVEVPRPRVFTITGMCCFMGMTRASFYVYKEREEFKEIVDHIQQIIENNKFELAAADMLNANMIGKDLGLLDRQEVNVTPYVISGEPEENEDEWLSKHKPT